MFTREDSTLLARLLAGGPPVNLAALTDGLARELAAAMLNPHGLSRDQAFNDRLALEPLAEQEAVRQAIMDADPDVPAGDQTGPPTRAPALDVPPLPEDVLQEASPAGGASAPVGWRAEALDGYVEHSRCVAPMAHDLFHASAFLCLIGMAIARRLVLNMPFGPIYPNLFILWLAETTLWTKTTALAVARQLGTELMGHLLAVDDTTPEALVCDLAGGRPSNLEEMPDEERAQWEQSRNFAAQRGLLLDEVSGLLASAGRDYMAGLLELFLRLYDCAPRFTRSTRGGGRVTVRHGYLTMLSASTPAALAGHLSAERLWSNGWWPRHALLTPDREKPAWARPREQTLADVVPDTIRRLMERLPPAAWPEPPEARCVSLDKALYAQWERYSKALRYDLITPDLPARLHGVYGRLPVQALKVATLLAACDWPERTEAPCITRPHLARAIAIAEDWRASAHRVLAIASSSRDDTLRTRIMSLLAAHPQEGVTLRDLRRSMPSTAPRQLLDALQQLEQVGEVRADHSKPGPEGGRPTTRYYPVMQ